MAQTTQIVPEFSFPYVKTVINDYTAVDDTAQGTATDTSITQAYAFFSGKGTNNVWVKRTNKEDAIRSFGKSNFKKYGQPLMQAMNVADQDNTSVWMMRVMPEDATFANVGITEWYRADDPADVDPEDPGSLADILDCKFHVAFVGRNYTELTNKAKLREIFNADTNMSVPKIKRYDRDGSEEYTELSYTGKIKPLTAVYTGSGICGNNYSMRITSVPSYEKELGIKMFDFESLTSENGLTSDMEYIGSVVTSPKYAGSTVTLIDDILSDLPKGVAPIDLTTDEDQIEVLYDAYITWINTKYAPAVKEKVEESWTVLKAACDAATPVIDIENGEIPAMGTEEYDLYLDWQKYSNAYDAVLPSNLPDLDQFDPLLGTRLSSTEILPAFEIDTPDSDPDPEDSGNNHAHHGADYYVNFTSAAGMTLAGGTDGSLDRQESESAAAYEVRLAKLKEELYIKAFDGTFDSIILSAKRMRISVFFDANYPFAVKKTINTLVHQRNYGRGFLDVGIIDALDYPVLNNLIADYKIFNDELMSVDIHNFIVREDTTNKKCRVTITYFLSWLWCEHMNYTGFQYAMAFKRAKLSGHIRDSLKPVIEDYDTKIKETLNDNRFNYFLCTGENEFQRGVQNTRQALNSDLTDENNSQIAHNLKNAIENDLYDILYDFSRPEDRQIFIRSEKDKYADWEGSVVNSFDIDFNVSKWEFEHSIIHCYIKIVFLQMNKRAILEIDLNKREFAENTFSAQTEE